MKCTLFILFLFTLLIACDNEPEFQQGITYINLQDVKAGYDKSFSLDIDQDGDSEYVFTTRLAADD